MIENLKYVGENGVLMTFDFDGEQKQIHFSDLERFWGDATEDYFEGGQAWIQDNLIVFTFLIASDQAGLVVIYDAEHDEIIHVSDGAYCIAAVIFDEYLYCLCAIHNYSVPYHWQMYAVKTGTIDPNCCGDRLYTQYPCRLYDSRIDDVKLKINDTGIRIMVNDETVYKYADTVNVDILKSQWNPNFGWLYHVFDEDDIGHQIIELEYCKHFDATIRSIFEWIT